MAPYLPFLWRPDQHMFLKPAVTQDFAARVGHRFAHDYETRLAVGVYESLLDLVGRTEMEIRDLKKPRDRIQAPSRRAARPDRQGRGRARRRPARPFRRRRNRAAPARGCGQASVIFALSPKTRQTVSPQHALLRGHRRLHVDRPEQVSFEGAHANTPLMERM